MVWGWTEDVRGISESRDPDESTTILLYCLKLDGNRDGNRLYNFIRSWIREVSAGLCPSLGLKLSQQRLISLDIGWEGEAIPI